MEANLETYWHYWGKAKLKENADGTLTHPLAHHNLDVAAVGLILCSPRVRG